MLSHRIVHKTCDSSASFGRGYTAHAQSVTMTTGDIYLPPGCGALREPLTASECRERRYFPGLAAGSPSGCCELQVVRNRHRAAAVDVVAAADGGGGGGGDG